MFQEDKVTDSAATTPEIGTYKEIPLNKLNRLHDHAFEDYEDEQFDRLLESIQSKGLIHPIVVRPLGDTGDYEILSGHNRKTVAEKLGWDTIPAMIRTMTDDEAVLFANEANVAQRRFENWRPSEKAKSIYQYHACIKKQGCRAGQKNVTSGEVRQKFDARKETARVYRVSENTIRLYLDLYRLIDPLKSRLDKEEFGTTPAQALSVVPVKIQEIVNTVIEEDKATCEITVATARKVRDEYRSCESGGIDEGAIKENIRLLLRKATDAPEVETTPVVVIKIKTSTYELLFPGREPDETVVREIIEAIEGYREMKTCNSFPRITKEDKKDKLLPVWGQEPLRRNEKGVGVFG